VLLPTAEENLDGTTGEPTPSPSNTPFTTWQEAQQDPKGNKTNSNTNINPEIEEIARKVTIMICPLTGMRATSNCPQKESQSFKEGEQPKDFCTFHVNPPR
jgi:hypothetical protein